MLAMVAILVMTILLIPGNVYVWLMIPIMVKNKK